MARRLLGPARLDPFALALLALAALCVLIAGLQHARLYHRGYAEVEYIGALFVLNAIGATGVILTLILQRAWLFVLGALAICVPSLVSSALSHSTGLLGGAAITTAVNQSFPTCPFRGDRREWGG